MIGVWVAVLMTAAVADVAAGVRVLTTAGSASRAQTTVPAATRPISAGTSRRPGSITTLHVPAPGTGSDHVVEVWRPAVPDSSRLPVVYLLHGVPGSARGLLQRTGLQARLDQWVQGGGRPFVVAVPDGNGDTHDDTEWADAADGSDLLETMVTQSVVRAVEGSRLRDAAHRAIAGFSMGGYGAMNLAMRHPDLFGAVVSVAGYFTVDDPDRMFGSDPAVLAANTPARHPQDARRLRVWLGVGQSDDEPVVRGQARAFARQLAQADVAYTLRSSPGGHSWSVVVDQWQEISAWLSRGFPKQ